MPPIAPATSTSGCSRSRRRRSRAGDRIGRPDTQPDWSPDGSTIVFRSERDGGGLYLVPALGGAERQLTSFGSHPSWFADSSDILFLEHSTLGAPEAPGRAVHRVSRRTAHRGRSSRRFLRRGAWSWIARHPRRTDLGDWAATASSDAGSSRFVGDGKPVRPVEGAAGCSALGPLRVATPRARRFQWHASGPRCTSRPNRRGLQPVESAVSIRRRCVGVGRAADDRRRPDVAAALSRDGTRLAFITEQGSTRCGCSPSIRSRVASAPESR